MLCNADVDDDDAAATTAAATDCGGRAMVLCVVAGGPPWGVVTMVLFVDGLEDAKGVVVDDDLLVEEDLPLDMDFKLLFPLLVVVSIPKPNNCIRCSSVS